MSNNYLTQLAHQNAQQYIVNALFDEKRIVEKSEASENQITLISKEEILNYYPTRDEKVHKLLEMARTVAITQVPLLITGESGIGKETFAKAIHIAGGYGKKEKGRFITAHSLNIPPQFFEMDLFSKQNKDSSSFLKNQSDDICTLFLDEITELDPAMQVKLLKVLKEQEGVVSGANIGFKQGTAVDSRIIACSIKDIQDEVNAKKFRSDLFFKLNVINFKIPPLRERLVDISFYAEMFINEYNTQFSRNVSLSPSANQALCSYPWPGNIRELRNTIQRAVLLAKNETIHVEDFHLIKANTRTEVALGEPLPQVTLGELEQRLILQTLRRMGGNRTHASKALGISLRALRYKLNELVDAGYEVEGKNI